MDINKKNLNKLLKFFHYSDKNFHKTLNRKNTKNIDKFKTSRINNSEWELIFKDLYEIFNTNFSLNISKNLSDLGLIYNLVKFNFVNNSNILFILPEETKYNKINKKFIKLFKSKDKDKNKNENYRINFIHNKNFKKILGFLTNFKQLNISQNKTLKNKKPNLIIMFNTDDYYKNCVIKEADLLNIPIISLISSDTIYSKLYIPLLGNLNLVTFNFYYHFFYKLIKSNDYIRINNLHKFSIKKNNYILNRKPSIKSIMLTYSYTKSKRNLLLIYKYKKGYERYRSFYENKYDGSFWGYFFYKHCPFDYSFFDEFSTEFLEKIPIIIKNRYKKKQRKKKELLNKKNKETIIKLNKKKTFGAKVLFFKKKRNTLEKKSKKRK